MDPQAWWAAWCALRGVVSAHATTEDLINFALDAHLAGATDGEVVSLVDYAGLVTSLWRTSDFVTLRLALPG